MKATGSKEDYANLKNAAFFAGCALSKLAPILCEQVFAWLKEQKLAAVSLAGCCGLPRFFEGEHDRYDHEVNAMFSRFEKRGITTIIAACPNCYYSIKRESEKQDRALRIVALPALLDAYGLKVGLDAVAENTLFTVHDSCPDREDLVFAASIRSLAGDLDTIEMKHHCSSALCCGTGQDFSLCTFDEQVAEAELRLAEAQAINAHAVITACASCTFALTAADSGLEIYHYLELLFEEWVDWCP